MKQLKIEEDPNSYPTFAIPAPDSVNGVALGANTAESITVPSGAKFALFSADTDFFARYTGTATVITDTTDGSGSELNPVIRSLLSSDTISVISENSCLITVSFYT